MSHNFGYNSHTDYLDSLDLDDINMVGLEAVDSDGYFYYLAIKSTQGDYASIEFGPLSPDEDILPDESIVKFTRGESKDKILIQIIQKFLSPKKRTKSAKAQYPKGVNQGNYAKITEVTQMTPDEALDHGLNLFEYLKKFSATSNF